MDILNGDLWLLVIYGFKENAYQFFVIEEVKERIYLLLF